MYSKIHIDYDNPPAGQWITRFDHCPFFSERRSLMLTEPICWFCKYAQFDLKNDKLPEAGICNYYDCSVRRRNNP